MNSIKSFLKRKNVVISRQRYLVDAMSAMTLGLFATLILGLIFDTVGQQILIASSENSLGVFFVELGTLAKSLFGSAIGASVAWGIGAPPIVVFANVVVGAAGFKYGNLAGAIIISIIATEAGKLVSKQTKLDLIVTPGVTLLVGMLTALTLGPPILKITDAVGFVINWATGEQPLVMGVVVSAMLGLALTGPISSAGLAIMLGLSGIAGGAATAGCSAHMIGFAVISFPVNGLGGLVSQGLGSSKLQLPNVSKNPWILAPVVATSMITGALSTMVFKMENIPDGSGMGTSGLVGQLGTITAMGSSAKVLLSIVLLHFVIPAVLALFFDYIFRKLGKIKREDYLLSNV